MRIRSGVVATTSTLTACFFPAAQSFRPPTYLLPLTTSFQTKTSSRLFTTHPDKMKESNSAKNEWVETLPLEDGSHRSSKIVIPDTAGKIDAFDESSFRERLAATVNCCREMNKSSIWIEVPMSRAALIEQMTEFGFKFHHTHNSRVVLNLWLKASPSKIPDFATHNVGVGAVVINSRDEILCVQELRQNYMKWKTPTGLSELGEELGTAACREVLEETGITTKFHSVLGFRQTHGLSHDRSDLYFVCRCDPVENLDANGNSIIPSPVPQEDEIATAAWVPFAEYRDMVNGADGTTGHPMMQHIVTVLQAGHTIRQSVVESVVPGRKPNAIYYPALLEPDP